MPFSKVLVKDVEASCGEDKGQVGRGSKQAPESSHVAGRVECGFGTLPSLV